ncbi:hypothetical protein NZD89_09745 [Alicyclobacillus fastidiosus]|uniref:Uncharacterized protein n=1 Tax=Alicyclobacillus fastidiosus TaxID=392011 RepID=A0ABY6ZL33_9BACL|nr:hypothetical protein [Alicyclobacillus fastidiosus]WAH43633.1 hypothetical protein NZD89_09745 [Alicyclobacillus fastidiosus]GMA59828.1 hypothetical protein GCM10025859_02680 [Alicyclobacillus fastidiosus]
MQARNLIYTIPVSAVRCAAICFAAVVTFALLSLMRVSVAYADVPAASDFGQGAAMVTHGSKSMQAALFVTEGTSGQFEVVEQPIVDDAVAAFAGEHPAWHLNVALTWYFMEPVYEKNTSTANDFDGRQQV